MLRRALLPALGISLTMLAAGVTAGDRHRTIRAFAELQPENEVPSISSGAHGTFKATIDRDNQTISYELTYEGLEDVPTQAHIHFGQRHTLGGVSVFLCGNPPNVPPATFPQPPACPAAPATVRGELSAANIVGPNAQGIAPSVNGVNEFDELVAAIVSGNTYANVHSAKFGGGEARGAIVTDERHGKH